MYVYSIRKVCNVTSTISMYIYTQLWHCCNNVIMLMMLPKKLDSGVKITWQC